MRPFNPFSHKQVPGSRASSERALSADTAARRKPKVLFVHPRHAPSFSGLEYLAPYAGIRYANPPLGILTLAGAISGNYDVEIRDANVRPADYPTDADIVGISGTLLHEVHVQRMAELARYFRGQGKLVCIGGPVASLCPDLCRPLCDVLFEGEGERTWPQFLRDYENGCWKDHYVEQEKIDLLNPPLPRIDLINVHDYGSGQVQTSRGCPFSCEFCEIIVLYGRKVRTKPTDHVIREIELWADAGQEHIFFSDDNFVGNRPYVKDLLRKLVVWNSQRRNPLYFYTQASIDTARDKELLELLRDANFAGIFIGIESPRKSSLAEMHKIQNLHTTDLIEAIRTVQSYGLQVSAGMIVGSDHDDPDIFEEQYRFLQEAGITYVQLSVLEATPKTPLWDRMKRDGRLVEYEDGFSTFIQPMSMTYQQLIDGFTWLIQKLYSFDAFKERYFTMLHQMRHHEFSMDRPRQTLRNWRAFLNIISFYAFHRNPQYRKFFREIIAGTMTINPRALNWAFRYLGYMIHWHKFAYSHVLTVRKEPSAQPAVASAEHAKAS